MCCEVIAQSRQVSDPRVRENRIKRSLSVPVRTTAKTCKTVCPRKCGDGHDWHGKCDFISKDLRKCCHIVSPTGLPVREQLILRATCAATKACALPGQGQNLGSCPQTVVGGMQGFCTLIAVKPPKPLYASSRCYEVLCLRNSTFHRPLVSIVVRTDCVHYSAIAEAQLAEMPLTSSPM